jgi:hypothetical protein
MDPATDIEEFRRELYVHVTELEDALRLFNEIPAVHEQFEKGGLQPLAMLAEAKQKITELKPEELSLMRATYAKFPGWRETSRTLNSLIKPALRQSLESRLAAKKGSGHMNAITPDNCQDGINADVSNTDISGAEAGLILAEGVMEALPTDGLTIVARLIPVIAFSAAQTGVLIATTLKAIKDDCTALDADDVQGIITASTNTIVANDNTNNDTILSSLTSAKNEIVNNDNSNKTAIINNDNSNTTTITASITNAQTNINNTSNANSAALLTSLTNSTNVIVANDNSNKTALITAISNAQGAVIGNSNANSNALKDLLLRTQIEADLAEADNATPVALYLTPTANGGYLDLVQTIVTETLANILAAGGSMADAQTFLNQANAQKAAGQFRAAYKSYRKAYKTVVNAT